MSYEAMRDSLDTGDIVLYDGHSVVSSVIKRFTFSRWSHVGMVVRSKELDAVLVYQSTTLSKVKDWIDDMPHRGVQINSLSQSIHSYRGDIAVRRLMNIERTELMVARLCEFRDEMKGRPYEKSELELIRAAYDGPGGHNEEDLSSLFCSELVAEAYQRMGLLADVDAGGKPSNEYTPKDFARINFVLLHGGLGQICMLKGKI